MPDTPTPHLIVAGRAYSWAELGAPDAPPPDAALGENGRAALEFARAWLRESDQFELQTSGSTGAPKPIVLTRRQMEASARATGRALGLAPGDQTLVCLPARYVAGRMMLVRCLVLGLTGYVVEPASDPFAELDLSVRLDFAAFVPLQMQTLLETALVAPGDSCYADETARAFRYRRLLDGMRAILVGGGPLVEGLEQQIGRLAAPVYHTYGMTETATHVALRRLNGDARSDHFVPLPGVQVAVDERGCLALRGEVSVGAWLQTNDLVELHVDRTFTWLGRWDNVINTGGVKVQIEAVEAAIQALQARRPHLPWVGRSLAIVGLPDARLGQVVTLVLSGAPISPDEEAPLLDLLRAELDRFSRPRRIAYLPRLPQTPTGKIDRKVLLAELTGG